MALDQAGNLFVTGGGMSGGLITVKYNSAGVRQWVREKPGSAGHSIRVDANGGIFVTGSLWNTVTGDDMMLLKYDLSGNLVWEKYYDFGNFEYGRLLNFDSHSNIYITGQGALTGAHVGWLIAKIDPSGNLLWYKRFKVSQTWEEYPYFALTGPQDELYVTGNVGTMSGGNQYNGLETVRYNSDGNRPWVADVNLYGGIGKGLALGTDMSLYAVGTYYYSVLKYSQSSPTGITQISSEIPEKYNLEQNYPNPFNPVTKIKFDLPKQSDVKIIVYDLPGREVDALVNQQLKPGSYEIEWNAASHSSGVYFYRLTSGNNVMTKKMSLIK
jgi:hypothetical protein